VSEAPAPPQRKLQLAQDLQRLLPTVEVTMIFDVGANVGQTVKDMAGAYPHATIHAFEPVGSSFDALEKLVAEGFPQMTPHRLAMSSASRIVEMTSNIKDTGNHFLRPNEAAPRTETVNAVTGESFCLTHGIDAISILKIDTEGHDLDCLLGFYGLLNDARIDVIQVEAGMNPENRRHVPLHHFQMLLEPLGYRLFRLYEQFAEFKSPKLRRVNPVFISPRLAALPRPGA
jgi:FkbM family methyltransferase